MAPVKIKFIVSFSSQDDNHRASNLVNSDGNNRWLSHPKDKSGKLELVLQLEEACTLSFIDIGTTWCSSLEVRVGRSDWPQSMEFKSLIPSVVLMSPVDCRLGRATSCTKMFSRADFSKEIATQQWDRLQIICRQTFRRDVQTGISFIRIKSVEAEKAVSPRQNNNSEIDSNVTRLQKHIFGNGSTGVESPAEALKFRLMKMSGSSENGCEHEQALSRTAKIVLKATEKAGPYRPFTVSPNRKSEFFSESLAKKNDVPIQEEIKTFLPTLKISPENIDILTIADLRHKFEKKKRRKLTTDEKRTFSEICQTFICDLLDKNSDVCGIDTLDTNPVICQSNVKETQDNHLMNMARKLTQQTKTLNPSSSSVPITLVKLSERPTGIISVNQAEVEVNRNGTSFVSKPILELKSKTNCLRSISKATPEKINYSVEKQITPRNKSISKDLSQTGSLSINNTEVKGTTPVESRITLMNYKNQRVSSERKLHQIRFFENPEGEQDAPIEVNARVSSLHSQIGSSDSKNGTNEVNDNYSDPRDISYNEKKGKPPQKLTLLSLKSGNGSIEKQNGQSLLPVENINKTKCKKSTSEAFKTERKPRVKRRKLNHSSLNLLQQFSSELFSDDETMPESFPEGSNMGVCSVKSGNTPDNSKHVKSVDSSTSLFMPGRIPFKSVHSAGMSDDQCKSDSTISKLSNSPVGPSLNASLEKTPKFKFRKSSNTPKPEKRRNQSDKKFTESPRGCDNRQHQRNLQSTDSYCDKCHGIFPSDEIASHWEFCMPLCGLSDQGSHHDEMLIDESVDYTECPICLQRFPQDVLLVHASDCGL